MQSSRETRILNTICVALVLLAGPIRLIGYQCKNFPYNTIICILYCGASFIWIYQVRKRVLQAEEQRYLVGTAFLIIFWIMLRTIKYEYMVKEHFIARFTWYLYYIPQIFCVVLMFLAVLHIGRPYGSPIHSRWKLIYVPSAMIVAGILTNDLHQFAFRFPEGLEAWDRVDYTYGPLYFAAVLWIAVLFLAILVVIFVRCSVPEKRGKIWMPLLPLLIVIVYGIAYGSPHENIILVMYKMPEVFCFTFAAFLETLMLAHLIPTNDSYEDFWNVSSIGAGIMNQADEIKYKSISSEEVTPKQIREAEHKAVFLKNGNVLLKSRRIHGGFCYWVRDISEINRLNQELSDLGDLLREENAMLNAENELKANRPRIEQQNRLYADIAKQVSPQLAILAEILAHLPHEEGEFEKKMKYACILNAYIKRYSNLFLLSHQNPLIGSVELQLALMESLEYVRLYGMIAHGSFQGEASFPGNRILLVYRIFEAVLETAIPQVRAVLVHMKTTEKCLVLCMELDSPKVSLPLDFIQQEMNGYGGSLTIERESHTEYVSVSLPGGECD